MDMQVDQVDSETEMCEDESAIDDNVNGMEAGQIFAQRHIFEKINMFIDVYRREGYSEDFIAGFIDGINDLTGGNISLQDDGETEALLDNPPDSD